MIGRRMMQKMLGHDPFEEDPFLSDPFFSDPFSAGPRRGRRGDGNDPFGGMLSHHRDGGFGGTLAAGMGSMGGATFVQSSSFSSNGRNVVSSSTSARIGPGGVAEIQRQVNDGRTGREEIMMERRIGDRGRRVQKTRNIDTGDEETVDNSYGIADGEEDMFDRDFQEAAAQRLMYHPRASHGMSRPTLAAPQRVPARSQGQHQVPMIGYEGASGGGTRRSAASRGPHAAASERSRW
mmetsp:Transcript_20028/g.46133  ORF Transcript_20028/g.46133 Transcript_20028/m.46133 type:complete len:236 (+) Transcript_20028:20-727(+)